MMFHPDIVTRCHAAVAAHQTNKYRLYQYHSLEWYTRVYHMIELYLPVYKQIPLSVVAGDHFITARNH